MRPVPPATAAAYAGGDFVTYCRVRVAVDAAGTSYVNLAELADHDWGMSFSVSDDVDTSVQSARLGLNRSVALLSLSPYMTTSKLNDGAPLLMAGRRIKVETATMPLDAFPSQQSATWVPLFDGWLDDVDPAKQTLEATARDLGALLQDMQIEEQKNYGSVSGVPVVEVMQAIVDDHVNAVLGTSIQVVAPAPPTFLIRTYAQAKEPVLDALRKLADQMGWVVRYRYDASHVPQLTLYEPPRQASTALRVFTPDDYFEVSQARQSRTNVRNRVAVYYTEPDALNLAGITIKGSRTRVVRNDFASQSKYRCVRYMEISEAATSQIDTAQEAADMADAALSDLAEPLLEWTVTLPFFFAAELGDTYTFTANGKHHDVDQTLAVTAIAHELTAQGATTSLTCRGRPVGSCRRWLAIEGRPGVAPSANMKDPAQPQVVVYGSPSSLVIDYDEPDPENWSTTEVYLKVDDGIALYQTTYQVVVPDPLPMGEDPATWTGLPGSTKLKYERPQGGAMVATGRQTRFVVDGLVPGTAYRVAIVVIDKAGNVSQMSSQVLSTAQQVGPYHTNRDGAQGMLIPNSDFNIYTRGPGYPPDGWSVRKHKQSVDPTQDQYPETLDNGWANGSAEQMTRNTQVVNQSGVSAVLIDMVKPLGRYELISDWVPIDAFAPLRISVLASMVLPYSTAPTFPTRGGSVRAYLEYAGADKERLVSAPPSAFDYLPFPPYTVGSMYQPVSATVGVTPGDARFFRLVIRAQSALMSAPGVVQSETDGAFKIAIDKVSVTRTPAKLLASRAFNPQSVNQTPGTPIGVPMGVQTGGNVGFVPTSLGTNVGYLVCLVPGLFNLVVTSVISIGSGSGTGVYSLVLYKNGIEIGRNSSATDGRQLTFVVPGIDLARRDKLELKMVTLSDAMRGNQIDQLTFSLNQTQALEL